MKKVKIDSFLISGIKTRTNNQNEQNPDTSKIAKLWEEFYAQNIPNQITDKKSFIYGIYSSYESDVNGSFDVLAGVAVSKKSDNFENVRILQGEYLVFAKSGTMPNAVIEAWQDVWSYFENSKEQRAYTTDFEKYINQDTVEIYISIQ